MSLTKPILADIEKQNGLKYQTIKNSMSKLTKLGVLIPLGSWTYRINPRYYWRGKSGERLKAMHYVLEFECPEC